MNTIDTENRLGLSFCERLELAFTHGKGTRVWDESGKAYRVDHGRASSRSARWNEKRAARPPSSPDIESA